MSSVTSMALSGGQPKYCNNAYVHVVLTNLCSWVYFLFLISMLMSSSKLFLFSKGPKEVHLNSGVRLLLELHCVVVIKHVAFTIWPKLTVAFTVPVYLWTFTLLFSDVVVVSDLNKNFGGSTDLAKKRHGSADLHTPIHPLPLIRARLVQILIL